MGPLNVDTRERAQDVAEPGVFTLPLNGAARAAVEAPGAAIVPSTSAQWPQQAHLVLSAIEAGRHGVTNRRGMRRRRYRVTAALKLYSDPDPSLSWPLYTRDVHSRGLGFITPHRLTLGHGGMVELPTADGTTVRIPCTLLRCREAAPGWFEGSVYFNRDQPQFLE